MADSSRIVDKEDGWTVREIVTSKHTHHREYYYKEKRAKRTRLQGKTVDQYAAYALIEKDLRNVLVWLEEIEKIFPLSQRIEKNSISPDREIFNIVKGLYVAALTFYGKCFTVSDGRKTKLERKILDPSFQRIHDDIMELRHNFAAHSGNAGAEFVSIAYVIPASKIKDRNASPMLFTELSQADMMFYNKDSKDMKSLVIHAQQKVLNKREALGKKIIEAQELEILKKHIER